MNTIITSLLLVFFICTPIVITSILIDRRSEKAKKSIKSFFAAVTPFAVGRWINDENKLAKENIKSFLYYTLKVLNTLLMVLSAYLYLAGQLILSLVISAFESIKKSFNKLSKKAA